MDNEKLNYKKFLSKRLKYERTDDENSDTEYQASLPIEKFKKIRNEFEESKLQKLEYTTKDISDLTKKFMKLDINNQQNLLENIQEESFTNTNMKSDNLEILDNLNNLDDFDNLENKIENDNFND